VLSIYGMLHMGCMASGKWGMCRSFLLTTSNGLVSLNNSLAASTKPTKIVQTVLDIKWVFVNFLALVFS
jgi:hypothetical protein